MAPVDPILRVAYGLRHSFDLDGVGECAAIAVPVLGEHPRTIVLGRSTGPFTREEVALVRSMARVLALTLRTLGILEDERRLRERSERQAHENARLVTQLQERQTLMERLGRIQRKISRRAALQEVLDAIVLGARELIGDEIVALRLVVPGHPGLVEIASSVGLDDATLQRVKRSPVGEGAGGRAVADDRLVVIEGYESARDGMDVFAASGVQAAMAAPIHGDGSPIGSLVVASYAPGRRYTTIEQEALERFADQASIAINDARAVEASLHQAFHDQLTDLPNRAQFFDRLEAALSAPGLRPGLLYIDVDRFKIVNDAYGHAKGDKLLTAVGKRLQGCLRDGDVAARLGGDEFAILISDAGSAATLVAIATRVLDAMRAPFSVDGAELVVTASIGLSLCEPGLDASSALRNADVAMYAAKTMGRGHYALFEPGMHAAVMDRIALETDLERAVRTDEFAVRYQPIVALDSEAIVGLEALVRWDHPTRGMLDPSEFVPFAEESSLIIGMGEHVLNRACADLAIWRARYPERNLGVNVNLSTREFMQPGLVDRVATALARAGLEPAALTLEITETVFMEDTEATIARLRALKDLGVCLAIDDFGTGYSSLRYLRRFPVDVLKIDKSFVDGLATGPEDSALARAIIGLGRMLDLRTVAEGIEHPEQVSRLRALRCDMGQGFLFHRPMDAQAVTELLARTGAPPTSRTLRSVG